MPTDKVAHVAVAWALALSLRLIGAPGWLSVGTTTAAIGAKEVMDGRHNSAAEHRRDIVAGLGGLVVAQGLWSYYERHERAKQDCALVASRCKDVLPPPRFVPASGALFVGTVAADSSARAALPADARLALPRLVSGQIR